MEKVKKKTAKREEYKTLTIKVGKHWHCLWNTACKNFIGEQPDRFALLEGKASTKGTLYFCDTYLEACAVRAITDGTAIYSDEQAYEGEPSFVVASPKSFKG